MNTSDLDPNLYRASSGTDTGLNIYSYTGDATSDFTAGVTAFSGSATYTLSVAEYNALLNSNENGDVYFPAGAEGDVAGATKIGTYSVTGNTLSIPVVASINLSYFPNPVTDVLNITAQKVIAQVDIYNMLGQYVHVQKLNALNGTINTANLANGTYFSRTTFQDGTIETFKVVKN
ncbi:T9SS type A sorting domain-containing protein [Bacteroidota bacterium]